MKKLLFALALLLLPTAASAQCNGVFSANTVCGAIVSGPPKQVPFASLPGSCPTLGAFQVGTGSGSQCSTTVGSTAVLNGGPFTINPTSGTTNQGLALTQTGPNTGSTVGNLPYNIINVSDGANVTGDPTSWALFVNYNILANATGNKFGVGVTINRSATTTQNGDLIGMFSNTVSSAPNNGNGGVFGGNFQAVKLSGANDQNEIAGSENSVRIDSGAAANWRFGTASVSTGAVRGTVLDAGYEVRNAVAGGEFLVGMLLHSQSSSVHPIATTGSVIGDDGVAATIANIISLPDYSCTGNILAVSTNVSIACGGNFTTNGSYTSLAANMGFITTDGTANAVFSVGSGFISHAAQFGTISNSPVVFITNNLNRGSISGGGVWNIGVTGTLTGQMGFSGSGTGTATITAQAAAGSPTLTLPNASGTFGVSGTSPITLNATTGAIGCSTCLTANQTITLSGDVTGSGTTAITTVLANAQPAVHTWALAQTFTTAPVFTDQSGSRTALGLGALATVTPGTGVATALAVNIGTAGSFVVNGGALGTPSSGTVTNLTGTASININGTVGATTPTTGAFTTVVTSTSETVPIVFGGTTAGSSLSLRSTSSGSPSGDFITLYTAGAEFARYTSANYLIGSTTAYAVNSEAQTAFTPTQQIHSAGAAATMSITRWSANANQGRFVMAKSRGSAVGTRGALTGNSVVNSGDFLGSIVFDGDDGTNFVAGAAIVAEAGGTVSTGVMPGILQFQTTPAAGGAALTNLTIFASGGVWVGQTPVDEAVNSLGVQGQMFMPSITTSSAAQTGTVCWTTGTGKFTVDTTVGCLTSIMGAKNITERLSPAKALNIVERLDPFAFRYKKGWGDGGRYEQFGFGAEEVATVDERLVGRDPQGELQGVRYQEMTAVLAGAIQQLSARTDRLEKGMIK